MKNGSLELDSCRVTWNEEEEAGVRREEEEEAGVRREEEEEEEVGVRRVTSVRDLSLSCSVASGNQTGGSGSDRTCFIKFRFTFIILCRQ